MNDSQNYSHSDWMGLALQAAQEAGDRGEVPVGALCVLDGSLISCAGNASIQNHDPSAHAEIRALRQAGQAIGNYRLVGVTLYCTLEPCSMCAGALVHARIKRLVYGAKDPRTGAIVSVRRLLDEPSHNHKVIHQGGVLASESSELLREFFRSRR